MGSKIINPINGSDLVNIEQIYDRSDLTLLYFKPTNNYYAGATPDFKKHVTKEQYIKLARKTSYEISILMSLPFIIGEILITLMLSLSIGQLNLYVLFPITLSVIFLIWVVSHTFIGITEKLNKIGINTNFISSYTNICLLLLAVPIYNLSNTLGNHLFSSFIYASGTLTLSIILCKLLLYLANSELMSYSMKIFLLTTPILGSIIIGSISIFLPVML